MSNIKLSSKAQCVDLIEEMKQKLEELQAKRQQTIELCRELMESHSITPELLFPELAMNVPQNGDEAPSTGKKRGRPVGSKNKATETPATTVAATETQPQADEETETVQPQSEETATAVIEPVQPALV